MDYKPLLLAGAGGLSGCGLDETNPERNLQNLRARLCIGTRSHAPPSGGREGAGAVNRPGDGRRGERGDGGSFTHMRVLLRRQSMHRVGDRPYQFPIRISRFGPHSTARPPAGRTKTIRWRRKEWEEAEQLA